METDISKIPNHVFDWMRDHSFENLDNEKQEVVLRYFTAEAYNDMHDAIQDVKQSFNLSSKHRKETIKQRLLQEFDAAPPVVLAKNNLLLYPIALWKVAATLVFLASAALWIARNKPASGESNLLAQADTVYITKQVMLELQRIQDTIFISEKNQPKSETKPARPAYENNSTEHSNITNLLHHTEFVYGIDALHNKANAVKKNNIRNDSIGKDFSFVTL